MDDKRKAERAEKQREYQREYQRKHREAKQAREEAFALAHAKVKAERAKETEEQVAEGPIHSAASAERTQDELVAAAQARVQVERKLDYEHAGKPDMEATVATAKQIAGRKRQLPTASEDTDEAPELAAHREALKVLEQEEKLRFDANRMRANGVAPTGVYRIAVRRQRTDPTSLFPKDRIHHTEDGRRFVTRWVRMSDGRGQPDKNLTRVQEFKDVYGYEIVTDKNDDPVISPLGILMQGHPDDYAARIIDYAPSGMAKLNAAQAELEDVSRLAKSPLTGFGVRTDRNPGAE